MSKNLSGTWLYIDGNWQKSYPPAQYSSGIINDNNSVKIFKQFNFKILYTKSNEMYWGTGVYFLN